MKYLFIILLFLSFPLWALDTEVKETLGKVHLYKFSEIEKVKYFIEDGKIKDEELQEYVYYTLVLGYQFHNKLDEYKKLGKIAYGKFKGPDKKLIHPALNKNKDSIKINFEIVLKKAKALSVKKEMLAKDMVLYNWTWISKARKKEIENQIQRKKEELARAKAQKERAKAEEAQKRANELYQKNQPRTFEFHTPDFTGEKFIVFFGTKSKGKFTNDPLNREKISFETICTYPIKIDVSKYGGIGALEAYVQSVTGFSRFMIYAEKTTAELQKTFDYTKQSKKVRISLIKFKAFLNDR